MSLRSKAINDRSNTIRIQYATESQAPSSITIDDLIFRLLDKQVGDAKVWLKDKAKEKRAELLKEANEMSKEKLLFKEVAGIRTEMTPDEFIRGKISASVRESAIMEIAKETLLTQI